MLESDGRVSDAGVSDAGAGRVWVGGPVPPGADAITLGSLIIVRRGAASNERLLRHERVHVRQWREHGLLGFLRRYVGAYLRWRLRGYGHHAAYLRIPFEVEATWEANWSAKRLSPRAERTPEG